MAACYEPTGGIQSPLPGLDGGTQLCGAALPCPEGELCHPSGVCIPCPGGSCGEQTDGSPPPADSSTQDMYNPPSDSGARDSGLDAASRLDATPMDQGATQDQCAPSVELCNGLDDDCDDLIDEGVDLLNDVDNCGECGTRCGERILNAESQCTQGSCDFIACAPGWSNADEDRSNGCESADPVFTIASPTAGDVFNSDFDVTIDMAGIESVGHVEVTANGELLGRRAPPAELVFTVMAAQFTDGQVRLVAEVVDLAGDVIATHEATVLLDRTAPVLRFLAPDGGLIIGDEPFDVRLEVVDLDPQVTVELFIDRDVFGQEDAAPFSFTLTPEDVGAGVHTLRAVARDRGGQETEALREIRLSFCAVDEMVAIPDMPSLMDKYENSRPDASEDDAGIDTRKSCSQPGVLPWSSIDFFDAEQACAASGKRLCRPDEWIRACGNIAIDRFPYGSVFDMQACNGVENPDTNGLTPTGSHPDCVADSGAVDLSGNLAEWTSEDIQRYGVYGGHYLSESPRMTCESVLFISRLRIIPAQGFRCCRDAQ